MSNQNQTQAQLVLSSQELTKDMDYFTSLGFQLNQIFPSDDPAVAIMSGHGIQIRLDKYADCNSPTLHLLTDTPEQFSDKELTAPNGTVIKILPKTYALQTPDTQHRFEVRKLTNSDPWVIGRAGMLYRDLIPDRLGGSIIASHINIPNGGPVPDVVHYHTIGFQLIFCYKGWVKLVYEDQGEPFILNAGDCVTQPPEIRHRVLEASDNLEVIEIGVPSDHMTTIDHDMELPNGIYNPNREFQGQRFCHHKAAEAIWKPWRISGFEHRDTGINEATKQKASVNVIRVLNSAIEQRYTNHDTDILFTFVMEGNMQLVAENYETHALNRGDAYVIPPHLNYKMLQCSSNLELLEVTLPGNFKTTTS
ncbi:cupin domain-containing protein [Winogradskyella immobilis]|uniref:Cupin domain-containing protein n=1 Tax=Winogradskyella immobilis TaxID=2816852 RepID=A0ABS8EP46_9FLAO|nr:cupin domain-containing protein [Winogradskyella immobilis]MCC1484989.1 cupin domain-containing protein [Winogradskyella immobilis]MCG0017081.1 cupin domain-containing protein [Winogradskyella immobilis]